MKCLDAIRNEVCVSASETGGPGTIAIDARDPRATANVSECRDMTIN